MAEDFDTEGDASLRHRLNAGRWAVNRQVELFRSQFGLVESGWKEDDSRVTFMDFAISEKIFADLRKTFPEDQYCSEESSPTDEVLELRSEFAWILDPIDGTNNYALGLPFAAISLALLRSGIPVYGFVYDWAQDRVVEGGDGFPLRIGSRRVFPVERPVSPQSLVALHFPLTPTEQETLRPILQTYKIRATGSTALNFTYVALGILDGCWDPKLKIWDIAAAWALLDSANKPRQWSGQPPFPLRSFHVSLPSFGLAAGGAAFMSEACPKFSPPAKAESADSPRRPG